MAPLSLSRNSFASSSALESSDYVLTKMRSYTTRDSYIHVTCRSVCSQDQDLYVIKKSCLDQFLMIT